MLAPGVRWFDDWFAIEDVAPGVVAIGEPRFHQINWNYLILGSRRALLFDTGPGVRDIAKIVRALTTLPVTALPSHLHFDHTGGLAKFRNIAMADLALLRAFEKNGWFNPSDDLYRGFREGMTWTPVKVDRWLPIGAEIDLGGKELRLIHTPGHSPDSVSLWDVASNILFAADYIYPGPLYAQIPGADLKAYLETAEIMLPQLMDNTTVLCAHGQPDVNGEYRAPRLGHADIAALASSLMKLRASNERPSQWPVNARMSLLLWEPAFASWQGA
jgi:glyoxylase-like metal-dependent hydrolase (beta-lactamase superfamily II)